MPVTLTLIGKRPGQQQFGLDTFTESYKCDATADVVLTDAGVPQMGSAHPDYDFMFVTQRYCSETSESASALDLTYTGCLTGEESPNLPAQQHISTQAVMSGTSSRGFDGTILTSPLSAQYYAPANKLQWITYGAAGEAGTASNPTADIVPITLTVGDTTYSPTGALATVINNFFTRLVVGALDTTEIVAGKFWQNGETKTLTLSPLIVSLTPGDYIVMYAPGSGYTVGNTLTINDGMGHTCSINVDSVGIGNSIVGFTPSSNTFDYTTTSPISASGGSGSGAAFYNYHIT